MISPAGLDGKEGVCSAGSASVGVKNSSPALTLKSLSLTLPRPTNTGRSFSETQRKLVEMLAIYIERVMQTVAGVFYCVFIITLILFLLSPPPHDVCTFFHLAKLACVYHPYFILLQITGTFSGRFQS